MSSIATALLGALLLCASLGARAAEVYAHIEFVEGTAKVVDATGGVRSARLGGEVLVGETIATGQDGEVHARTGDHGLVALRANTQVKVEVFHAQGADDDSTLLSLLHGTFRSITGWIGKHRPDAYRIKTPTATIGIRGTDHEPMYLEAPAGGLAAGTYDKVNSGATFLEAGGHRVDIEAGRAAHAPLRGEAKLLDHIPEVYKPTRNEARIAHRKEELAHEVEAMRAQAQKKAAQQRPEKEAAAKEQHAKPNESKAGGDDKAAGPGEKKSAAEPGSPHEAREEHSKERHRRGHGPR